MNEPKPPPGKLVPQTHCWPAVDVDCEEWVKNVSDVPIEQWSRGKLVSLIESWPPIVVDCSGWVKAEPSVPFQIILEVFAEGSDNSDAVREKIVALYRSLNEYNLAKYGRRLTAKMFREYLFAGIQVEA